MRSFRVEAGSTSFNAAISACEKRLECRVPEGFRVEGLGFRVGSMMVQGLSCSIRV